MNALGVLRLCAAIAALFPLPAYLLAKAVFPRRGLEATHAGALFVFTGLALDLVALVLIGLALGFAGLFTLGAILASVLALNVGAALAAWRRKAWVRGVPREPAPEPQPPKRLTAIERARAEGDHQRAKALEDEAGDELYG